MTDGHGGEPPALARCPVCGAEARFLSDYRAILGEDAAAVALFSELEVMRCASCGHGFAIPEVDEGALAEYYRQLYWNDRARALGGSALGRLRTAARRVRSAIGSRIHEPGGPSRIQAEILLGSAGFPGLRAMRPRLRSLEVGAGAAGFSRCLRRMAGGVRCSVLEPSDEFGLLYFANGLQRVAATIEELPPEAAFEIIQMSHVLEHLVRPLRALRILGTHLVPGGLLYVEVPNCGDPYWSHRHHPSPPHLSFFTATSLAMAVRSAGLEVVDVTSHGLSLRAEESIGFLDEGQGKLATLEELQDLSRRRRERHRALRGMDVGRGGSGAVDRANLVVIAVAPGPDPQVEARR